MDEFGDGVKPEKQDVYETIVAEVRAGSGAAVELLSFDKQKDRIAPVLQQVRDLAPAAVVALGSAALKIALEQKAPFPCPLLFTGVLNPEIYVAGKPSVRGVSLNVDSARQLRLIAEYFPALRNIGILYVPGESDAQVAAARVEAERLKLKLSAEPVKNLPEALRAVDRLEALPVSVFLMLPDSLVNEERLFDRLRQASVRGDIPLLSPTRRHLLDDALLTFEIDYRQVGRDTAELVAATLSGPAPAGGQVLHQQQPRIGVNRKIARALEIELPDRLLRNADFQVD